MHPVKIDRDMKETDLVLEKSLPKGHLKIRDWHHQWGSRTLIMAIVNCTPDSFSSDGSLCGDTALEMALAAIEDGADIIDVGGESTRPGFSPVSVQEEISRVVPVISALRAARPDAIISVDTTKPEVFQQARAAGAVILNSIWMPQGSLLEELLVTKAPLVVMHNKEQAAYQGCLIDEVRASFLEYANMLLAHGLVRENIILDPGIGFGKTAEHNMEILRSLDQLANLGFPTLIGTSRKSFIGALTDKKAPHRDFGTAATLALAIQAGVDIVRVHNVKMALDVVRVTDAIIRTSRAGNDPQPVGGIDRSYL
jgi:dihydropteroate synthase